MGTPLFVLTGWLYPTIKEHPLTDPIHGSCLCGQSRFTIVPPFRGFQYCHCSRCRKASGTAHAANIFVLKDQLAWLEGEGGAKRFDLPEAKWWSTAFCGACGAALPWLSRNGRAWVVPAGALDDDPGEKPRRSIYFGSKASWYEHVSDMPMFDTFPEDT